MFTYDSFSLNIQDPSTSGLIFIIPSAYIFISQKTGKKWSPTSYSPQKYVLSK